MHVDVVIKKKVAEQAIPLADGSVSFVEDAQVELELRAFGSIRQHSPALIG
jgi:hypothetical protein